MATTLSWNGIEITVPDGARLHKNCLYVLLEWDEVAINISLTVGVPPGSPIMVIQRCRENTTDPRGKNLRILPDSSRTFKVSVYTEYLVHVWFNDTLLSICASNKDTPSE